MKTKTVEFVYNQKIESSKSRPNDKKGTKKRAKMLEKKKKEELV